MRRIRAPTGRRRGSAADTGRRRAGEVESLLLVLLVEAGRGDGETAAALLADGLLDEDEEEDAC